MAKQVKIVRPKSAFNLDEILANTRKLHEERIRKAGKHRCVATPAGSMARVTGKGDRILKRPVIIMRFYECKICGRDMKKVRRK